jgi:hypothetical protein
MNLINEYTERFYRLFKQFQRKQITKREIKNEISYLVSELIEEVRQDGNV